MLGIVEISKENNSYDYIDFLQVKPEYVHKRKNIFEKIIDKLNPNKNEEKPKYSGIGTAILNSLKQISDKNLKLSSVDSAIKFYKKNNFKKVGYNTMLWENPKTN